MQAAIAAHYGNNYALSLALVAIVFALVIAVLTAFGVKAKGVVFGARPRTATSPGRRTNAISPAPPSGLQVAPPGASP